MFLSQLSIAATVTVASIYIATAALPGHKEDVLISIKKMTASKPVDYYCESEINHGCGIFIIVITKH